MTKGQAERSEERKDGEQRKPSRSELAAALAALAERVAALEQGPSAEKASRLAVADLVPALRDLLEDGGGSSAASGFVVYAGVGSRSDGEVALQVGRRWEDVLGVDRGRGERALAALGSPARLDIVEALVSGPLSRQDLQARLDRATAGQLNHHLRELLAAGILEQPSRGVYEVPQSRVVPILTLLSCATDLVPAGSGLRSI
jgi:DNA-binding transcriptional ArsR family regulator